MLYVFSAVVVTIQRGVFQFANDYAIFRASFWNLLRGRDLYALHVDQAHDVFKYSPTFAALFAPLSLLPSSIGLLIWNVLGASMLIYAIVRLLPEHKANLVLLIAYLPMLRNLQSTQSNTLVAALIILAFVALERGEQWRGALAVGIGAAIKIFPLAALSLAIPHRHRLRFAVCFIVIAIALLILPLLFTSPYLLAAQYRAWAVLEAREIQDSGASVMGMVHTWLRLDWPTVGVQIGGTVLLLLPVCFRRQLWMETPHLRLRFLALLLVYCVIFNQKAEPQSYVIALVGIAIWYVVSPRSGWHTALLVIALMLTSGLGPIPEFIKAPLTPLIRRPLPCTVVWLVMQAELIAALRFAPSEMTSTRLAAVTEREVVVVPTTE
ncbi:MAG: glycosyltransferase family 87 protein [Gemmatimonadaceae bacterium]